MNLTSNPAINNSWKRFKLQYVAAACGLALAASSAAYVGGPLKGARQAPAGARASAMASYARTASQPFYYFIVGDGEQAAALESAISRDSAAYDHSGVQHRTLVVQNEEQEFYLNLAVRETMALGTNVQFLDLRSGSPLSLTGSSPRAEAVRSLGNESAAEYAAREAAQFLSLEPSAAASLPGGRAAGGD
jgi:hypothetical protein